MDGQKFRKRTFKKERLLKNPYVRLLSIYRTFHHAKLPNHLSNRSQDTRTTLFWAQNYGTMAILTQHRPLLFHICHICLLMLNLKSYEAVKVKIVNSSERMRNEWMDGKKIRVLFAYGTP